MSIKLALDVPEAAAAASVSDSTIRTAIHSGVLKAKRSGVDKDGLPSGKYLITPAALANWLDSLPDA